MIYSKSKQFITSAFNIEIYKNTKCTQLLVGKMSIQKAIEWENTNIYENQKDLFSNTLNSSSWKPGSDKGRFIFYFAFSS